MANIKSAKKRIITSAKRTAANKAVKSSVKTAIKKVHKAAAAALVAAEATIDKACTKGVLHKNNASRKVSRLASFVNKI